MPVTIMTSVGTVLALPGSCILVNSYNSFSFRSLTNDAQRGPRIRYIAAQQRVPGHHHGLPCTESLPQGIQGIVASEEAQVDVGL